MKLFSLIPELCIILLLGVLWIRVILEKKIHHPRTSELALIFCGIAVVASCFTLKQNHLLFYGTYQIDMLSQSFKTLLAFILFATLFLSNNLTAIVIHKKTEYMMFITTATLGLMMLTSSVEMLTLVIALELVAYSLYVAIPLGAKATSAEGSLKYILFGAAMTGLLLYGASLVMGLTQSTHWAIMAQTAPQFQNVPVYLLATFFILTVLLFKLSLFPFHHWAPDVYASAPITVTSFIATASKLAGIAVLIRWFHVMGLPPAFIPIFSFLAFMSMTWGNTSALWQKDLKRLMAYSSIAQAGYMMIAILSGTQEAYQATLFYGIVYAISNLAVFVVFIHVARHCREDNPKIEHLNGLADKSGLLAFLLLLSVLSLAGIPPLAGFAGKWFLFTAAMQQGHWFLVLFAVINSVVSLYYYLTLVKHTYLGKPLSDSKVALSQYDKWLCLGLILALVTIGLFPQTLWALMPFLLP